MAEEVLATAIPAGIDEAEEFGQRVPIAPVGWNGFTVTRVVEKSGAGKKIHEVYFENANGEEARRGFFLHAEAIGFYIAFLRLAAPDVTKYAGLNPNAVLRGRRVDGLVSHKTGPWTNPKTQKTTQITNADVDAFRAYTGSAPAHASGNGAPNPNAASTPPTASADPDLPF